MVFSCEKGRESRKCFLTLLYAPPIGVNSVLSCLGSCLGINSSHTVHICRLSKLKSVEAELKEKTKHLKKLEKDLDAEAQQVVLLKEKVMG